MKRSKLVSGYKDNIRLEQTREVTGMKNAGGRTFLLVDKTWTQHALKARGAREIKITYMSDAWFEILALRPELSDVLQLGEQVKFQVKEGLILTISPEGRDTLTEEERSLLKKA